MRCDVNMKFLPEPRVTLLDTNQKFEFKNYRYCPKCSGKLDEDENCENHRTGWALLLDGGPFFIERNSPLYKELTEIMSAARAPDLFATFSTKLCDVAKKIDNNESRDFMDGIALLSDKNPTAWINPEDDLPF